jgi:hypothetical protein
MTEQKPKRIILPPKKKQVTLETSSIIPATELLLHDAKAIIGAELAHYRSKAVRGVTLDPKEARIVQGYLESLVKIQTGRTRNGRGSRFVHPLGYRIAAPSQTSLRS